MIYIWVDDMRQAPRDWIWCKSVNETIRLIRDTMKRGITIGAMDLDHDAGDYADDGGDYIRILDWMESNGVNIPIQLHSMNPVGRRRMEQIVEKNGWNKKI